MVTNCHVHVTSASRHEFGVQSRARNGRPHELSEYNTLYMMA